MKIHNFRNNHFFHRILVFFFGWTIPKIHLVSWHRWTQFRRLHLRSAKWWSTFHFVYLQINDHPRQIPVFYDGNRGKEKKHYPRFYPVVKKPELPIFLRTLPPGGKVFFLNYYLDVMDVARKLWHQGFLVWVNRDHL